MAEEKQSILKFYFQARWQTALITHFLIAVFYLVLFYFGNLWNAFQFAFYTFLSSADMLGLEFAAWGIVFEISTIVPFLVAWYAIFLLPQIWLSRFSKFQKTLLTILMLVLIPMIVIIFEAVSKYALETDVLRDFVSYHNIL